MKTNWEIIHLPLSPLERKRRTTNVIHDLHDSLRFTSFFLTGTSEKIKVTLFHLYLLIDYQCFLVVRGIQNRVRNSLLKTSYNQSAALQYRQQWSESPDFLVKRQRHNWSNIFTSDWLFGDPYPHLHSAIWILMKVNGIISISKCVWYTE